jgi:uncharacterized protein YegP (UPF0339 family)
MTNHNAVTPPKRKYRFIVYQDKKHEWRWKLTAGNNKTIADSAEGYKRMESAMQQVEHIQDWAQNSEIVIQSGKSVSLAGPEPED